MALRDLSSSGPKALSNRRLKGISTPGKLVALSRQEISSPSIRSGRAQDGDAFLRSQTFVNGFGNDRWRPMVQTFSVQNNKGLRLWAATADSDAIQNGSASRAFVTDEFPRTVAMPFNHEPLIEGEDES
jgi:hypothetical protein